MSSKRKSAVEKSTADFYVSMYFRVNRLGVRTKTWTSISTNGIRMRMTEVMHHEQLQKKKPSDDRSLLKSPIVVKVKNGHVIEASLDDPISMILNRSNRHSEFIERFDLSLYHG